MGGSGSGMVVGVCDATAAGAGGEGGASYEARAWGLSLSHGAFFAKPRGEGGVAPIHSMIAVSLRKQ